VNTPKYIALGLMSGTSLDGVDAAFLETDGQRIVRLGPSLCLDYSDADKATLQEATQAALRWQFKGLRPNIFSAAESVIHKCHIRAVKSLCADHREWADKLAVIGFHGQTVATLLPLIRALEMARWIIGCPKTIWVILTLTGHMPPRAHPIFR